MMNTNDVAGGEGSEVRLGVGGELRAAREAQGISVAEVAQALKFSQRQVELVEANAWTQLPGRTFVRGFVRNYARALQLDPGPLLHRLESAEMPEPPVLDMPRSTEASLPHSGQVRRNEYAVMVGAALLVSLAVLAYFLVPDDLWQLTAKFGMSQTQVAAPAASSPPTANAPAAMPAAEVPAAAPSSPVPQTAMSAAAGGTPPGTSTIALPAAPVLPEATTATAPTAIPAAPTSGAPASAGGHLRLKFGQASWVEVRDRNGKILMSQMNDAGTTHELAGDPPFSLTIGDARQVSVFFNERPVDLTPFFSERSRVARLRIE